MKPCQHNKSLLTNIALLYGTGVKKNINCSFKEFKSGYINFFCTKCKNDFCLIIKIPIKYMTEPQKNEIDKYVHVINSTNWRFRISKWLGTHLFTAADWKHILYSINNNNSTWFSTFKYQIAL